MISKLATVGIYTLGIPFIAAFVFFTGAYGWFANGFVLAHMWSWYAVPLGAPVVGWVTFAGALMAKAILTGIPATPESDKKPDMAKAGATLIVGLAWPWMVLLIAWWLK